jgi:hypothetical protein
MSKKRIEINTGDIYSRLSIVEEVEPFRGLNGNIMRKCLCRCECGNEIVTRLADLRRGHTQSCGCWHIDRITRHGHSRREDITATYYAWQNMKERCTNPKNKKYRDYGLRGINVCGRWLEGFENFLADMGECPEGLTLERIDNNGNYEPDNCKWATVSEQNRNRRTKQEISNDRRHLDG